MNRWLPEFSVRRPVTVVMGFLALLVLGAIAWSRIPLEMMPGRFSVNTLWVWVPYRDSTPRENEKAIVKPIEEQVATAPGIKSIRSSARAGSAQLSLDFHRSVSMEAAYNAVVDRLERAMVDLPADVDRYWIYKWNPSDEPVVWAGVSLGQDVDDPHRLMSEVVQKRLERVPGVGLVETWGVDERVVFIDFNLDQLITHGVSLYQVVAVLGSDNFQLPSGRIEEHGQVRYVRNLARWQDLDDLRFTPVGPGVVLGDVAEVRLQVDKDLSIGHIDGREGAALAVSKESDANTVQVAENIASAMRELEADPRTQGARFVTFFDQGELIRGSIDDLLSTAGWGGLFAVIVLYSFLREWRLTLLIAACMPFTLLLTITLLYFLGRTLNLLSLMGLMLAVGMVVDNAIVVVEAIYARRQQGEAPEEAAIDGTSEVNLAITLSTLTTMVVFLPIILMSEDANFSFFMGELGMPVVYALGASLLVALVFTPLTTTLLRRRGGGSGLPPQPRWIVWLARRYQRGLRIVLTRRTDALVGVVAVAFVTFVVPVKAVGCQDEAEGSIGDFVVRYEVPDKLTYAERFEVVETFEHWVDEHRQSWGVRTHRSRLSEGSTSGRTHVHLYEVRDDDMMPREKVLKEARETLPEMPGVTAQIGWGDSGGPPPHQARVVLRGEDTDTLDLIGEEVTRVLRAVPGVIGVHPDLEDEGGEEIRLVVDRAAAAKYGIDARRIGQTVSFALRGAPLPKYHDNGKEVEVIARFRQEDRADMERLLDFPMFSTQTLSAVPLRALVTREVGSGTGTIQREDRTTAYPITADLNQDLEMGQAWTDIEAALGALDLPRGYSWDRGSRYDDEAENDEARNLALLLSVTFVFLIMGVLFESFLLPLSVITSIPMALFGVYWMLYLTGTPLDVMGGVGLVILIGVVVNNGIVLVDLVTRLRAEGMPRTEALVEAGGRRMRPILMTALTTIFGLLPMATGTSTFIGLPYAPLGRVVAGGMIAGTVLTLFFVPYLYSVLDDMRDTGWRWLAWVVRRGSAGAVSSPEPSGGAK